MVHDLQHLLIPGVDDAVVFRLISTHYDRHSRPAQMRGQKGPAEVVKNGLRVLAISNLKPTEGGLMDLGPAEDCCRVDWRALERTIVRLRLVCLQENLPWAKLNAVAGGRCPAECSWLLRWHVHPAQSPNPPLLPDP